MATLPFFAVAFLAICMVIPTALSLECYACSSHPQFVGGSSCNSDNVPKITCPMFFDRCFTMKAIMSIGVGAPISVELRNCTVNQLCNPQSPISICKSFNSSGMASICIADCCASDLCNVESSTSIPAPSTVSPTPGVVQFTPSAVQPTPIVVQSTPSVVQSMPIVVQSMPSVVQSMPSVVQATPSVVQSMPSVVQSTTSKPICAVLALAPSFCVIFSLFLL